MDSESLAGDDGPLAAAAPASPVRRVAVCIATCGRPTLLSGLLQSLRALRFSRSAAPALRVVVVDNDPDETARPVVEEVRPVFPWPLTYAAEPIRNISLARNAAVRLALAEAADFVAFVDDDEEVTPEWLDELLTAADRFGADAVCGPVLPRYARDVPNWVVAGRLLEPRRYRTGDRLSFGMTGNALITARALRGEVEPFHPLLGSSGGEDTYFFMRLARAGGGVVWADEAIVDEYIPASRARAGSLISRAFRVGNCYVVCERLLSPSGRWRFARATAALGRLVAGALLLLPGVLGGRATAVRALRIAAHGAGAVAALGGIRYYQYRSNGQA